MKEFMNSFLLLYAYGFGKGGDIANPFNMETEDSFNILAEDNYYILNEG